MTMYADRALRCVACSTDFVFTAREQAFHEQKGFTNEPRRCPSCRQARRSTSTRAGAPADVSAPAPTTEANGAPQRPQPDVSTQRFTTVCSACGGAAQLPFEPVGNRPALCGDCYDKIRATA